MSNTLLERTRQLHEDIERAERLAAKDLKRTMTRYKDRVQQDHRTKRFIDEVQEASRKLVRLALCCLIQSASISGHHVPVSPLCCQRACAHVAPAGRCITCID